MDQKPVSVYLQKQRDNKESDLSSLENQSKALESSSVRVKVNFDEKLATYQSWKLANGVTGILF